MISAINNLQPLSTIRFSHAGVHGSNANKSTTSQESSTEEAHQPTSITSKIKGFLNSNNSIFLGVFTAEILEFVIKHPLLLLAALPIFAMVGAYKVSQKLLDPLFKKLGNWSEAKITQLAQKRA